MAWTVLIDDRFEAWRQTLDADEQESLRRSIDLLRQLGPLLGRPNADTVRGSKHANMKELRTQHRGRPLRSLFAFDPIRRAVLLIGGDKTGDKRFYERLIPLADAIFDAHLKTVAKQQREQKGRQ